MHRSTILVTLVSLFTLACGEQPPPQSISIDTRFDASQRAIITDAIDQWCDAVGWCPEIVSDGEAHVVCETHEQYVRSGAKKNSVAHNHSENSILDPVGGFDVHVDCEALNDPDAMKGDPIGAFTNAIIHEFGHFGTREHTKVGLMSIRVTFVTCIDTLSARKWCHETSCVQEPRTTCDPSVDIE